MTSPKTGVLLLGGTGKVASRIAAQLQAIHRPVLIASRNATGPSSVVFDWADKTTWGNAYAAATPGKPSQGGPPISTVFVVAPPWLDSAPATNEYIDFARSQGARRFVLLSASSIEAGGPAMGQVHAYLQELGDKGEVEWAVLRPTWFQQNLSEQPNHAVSIKQEGKIYSATSDGKIPWVSADDIAAVAVQALTREEPPNTDYLILGPELLSYGDVADILSDVLGKKVVHDDLSSSELEAKLQGSGVPEDYAKMLSAMDTAIKHGSENRTNDVILSVTGKSPRRFREHAEAAKSVWQ